MEVEVLVACNKTGGFLIISKKEAKIVKMDEKNIYNKVLDMVIVALKNRKKRKIKNLQSELQVLNCLELLFC